MFFIGVYNTVNWSRLGLSLKHITEIECCVLKGKKRKKIYNSILIMKFPMQSLNMDIFMYFFWTKIKLFLYVWHFKKKCTTFFFCFMHIRCFEYCQNRHFTIGSTFKRQTSMTRISDRVLIRKIIIRNTN